MRHEYAFDCAARLTADRVTAVPDPNVDCAVLRIETAYDELGRTSTITSYDSNATGGGNVVNQVAHSYDANFFGALVKTRQAHSGATGAGARRPVRRGVNHQSQSNQSQSGDTIRIILDSVSGWAMVVLWRDWPERCCLGFRITSLSAGIEGSRLFSGIKRESSDTIRKTIWCPLISADFSLVNPSTATRNSMAAPGCLFKNSGYMEVHVAHGGLEL